MAAATTAASGQQPTVFPHSHVGFDSITSQIERKLLKRGFQFNVMCVGMYKLVLIHCFWTRLDSTLFLDSWLTLNARRTNRPWQIDSSQHHLRIPPDRLQGPPRPQ
jgi:septin family protein